MFSHRCAAALLMGHGFDSRLCWQSTYSDVDPAIAAWLSRIKPSALLVGPRCCSLAPMEEAYNARVADVPLSRADRRELWKRLHDSATSVASSVLHDDESDAAPAPRQMHTAVSVAEVEEAPPARSMHNSADSAGHEDASADEHASGLVRTAVAEVEVAAPVEAEAAAHNIPCQSRSGSSTECALCLDTAITPVHWPGECRHCFCEVCCYGLLSAGYELCPLCRGALPEDFSVLDVLLGQSSLKRDAATAHECRALAPEQYAKRERANQAHLECAIEKRSQRALLEVLRGAYTTGSRWSRDHRRRLLIDITIEYQALEIERHRMASNTRED